jgi:hypothetical protein
MSYNSKVKKPKLGDVVEIPLPNGKYAYGRVYKDASIAIYKKLSEEPHQPPIGSRDFLFHVGLYDDILTSGDWAVVGHDKFNSTESSWPPPYFIKDIISGGYEIYHKGDIRKASKDECKNLEEAAVWDKQHIIERIIREFQKG